jgi:hypothetical protein
MASTFTFIHSVTHFHSFLSLSLSLSLCTYVSDVFVFLSFLAADMHRQADISCEHTDALETDPLSKKHVLFITDTVYTHARYIHTRLA